MKCNASHKNHINEYSKRYEGNMNIVYIYGNTKLHISTLRALTAG